MVSEDSVKEKSVFSVPVPLRFRDLDAMGHVNNAVYFTYFEQGRYFFFKNLLQTEDASSFPFILASIRCDYRRPMTLVHRPELHLWVKEIGTKSFVFAYRICEASDQSIIYATGESVQVWYDYGLGRSIPIPENMVQRLSAYMPITS